MTIEEVRRRVADVRLSANDDEIAHFEEDRLHQDVLRAIAEGRCDDPAALAAAALVTTTFDFGRWCA